LRFAEGFYSYGFWVVIVMALFLLWAEKKRSQLLKKIAEPQLIDNIAYSASSKKRKIKYSFLACLVVFSVIALMRPQWGFQWQEVKRKGLDILIAIDTSKSMLARDVRPNRFERSKLAVKDLVKRIRGDRIGLIAFAGTAYLQCPLTVDYGGFLLALNGLKVGTIPKGGTSIKSAILVAMKSFEGGQKEEKALIIITDGEDHEGGLKALAEKARKEGIKIFCIGIGTREGELIQIYDDKGKKTFLKDKSGNIVKSRLNEAILKEIALSTGGTYVRSSGAEFGLELIYDEKLSKMEEKEIKAEMQKLYYDRFQIPLFFALILLIIEPLVSDRKRRL